MFSNRTQHHRCKLCLNISVRTCCTRLWRSWNDNQICSTSRSRVEIRCECVVGWNFHSHRLSKFWGGTIWVGYFLEITVVALVLWSQKRCRQLYSSWVPLVQFASDFCGWVSQESDGDAKGFKEGEATPAKVLMFSTSVKFSPFQYQSGRQSFMPEILTR